MKARIDAKALAGAVGIVAPFVPRATGLAALSYLFVDIGDEHATLTGGDLETFCRTHCDIEPTTIHEPGRMLVPPVFLARALAAVDGIVDLDCDGNELTVTGPGRTFTIRCANPDDYPAVDWSVPTVPLGDLRDAVGKVMHAASDDMNRPLITGVHFQPGKIEATDSYRAAWTAVDHELVEATVPAGPLRRAFKLLGDTLELGLDDGRCAIGDGTTLIVTRLIDGAYPDIERLAPAKTSWSITVDRDDLVSAVTAAVATPGAVTKVGSNVRFTVDGDSLDVSSIVQDVGEAHATIPASFTGTVPHPLAYGPDYLIDAAAVAGDTVTIRGVDASKPCIIDGNGVTQIIMPVRVA